MNEQTSIMYHNLHKTYLEKMEDLQQSQSYLSLTDIEKVVEEVNLGYVSDYVACTSIDKIERGFVIASFKKIDDYDIAMELHDDYLKGFLQKHYKTIENHKYSSPIAVIPMIEVDYVTRYNDELTISCENLETLLDTLDSNPTTRPYVEIKFDKYEGVFFYDASY